MKRFFAVLLASVMFFSICSAEDISVSKDDVINVAKQVITAFDEDPENVTPLVIIRTYLELKTVINAQEERLVQDLYKLVSSGVEKSIADGLITNYKLIICDWDNVLGNTETVWQSWLDGFISDDECAEFILNWLRALAAGRESKLSTGDIDGQSAVKENVIYINDNANLLSEEEETELYNTMIPVLDFASAGFLTLPAGGSNKASADKLRDWGNELFGIDAGYVAFIIDMVNRHLDIYASAALADILSSDVLNVICENTYLYATRGEYAKCAMETFKLIENALKGEKIVP